MIHSHLPVIWAGIIGFAVFAYVLMDGFERSAKNAIKR